MNSSSPTNYVPAAIGVAGTVSCFYLASVITFATLRGNPVEVRLFAFGAELNVRMNCVEKPQPSINHGPSKNNSPDDDDRHEVLIASSD